MKLFFQILLLLLFTKTSEAKLQLPKILGHNMVLQQGAPIPIWGKANSGATVTVRFMNQQKTTKANLNGQWKIYLNPAAASFAEHNLYITSNNESIELKHILIGEVWLCSGQSNMEFAMRKLEKLKPPAGADWPVDELEKASNKQIRIFLVERKKMQPDSTHSGWETATGKALRNFSEIGYFFGKELYKKLRVPVGIVSAAIPGSSIEPWMPAEAMLNEPFFKNSGQPISSDAGKFYTSMIEPLIPFSIKGFLWYQGESNCFLNERIEYTYKMKSLINDWRVKWKDESLPFYYIQIAPYFYSKATDRPYTVYSEPEFWEAQVTALKIKNTAMIATIDLNPNPADLHPVNKWEVAERLAAATLSKTYKINERPAMGPIFKSAVLQGDSFVIDFDYKGSGLKTRDGKPLMGFEVEDGKGVFHQAGAVIKNDKVWVSAPNVRKPKSARFAWRENALSNLINAEGLPAMPFRTNNTVWKSFNPN